MKSCRVCKSNVFKYNAMESGQSFAVYRHNDCYLHLKNGSFGNNVLRLVSGNCNLDESDALRDIKDFETLDSLARDLVLNSENLRLLGDKILSVVDGNFVLEYTLDCLRYEATFYVPEERELFSLSTNILGSNITSTEYTRDKSLLMLFFSPFAKRFPGHLETASSVIK